MKRVLFALSIILAAAVFALMIVEGFFELNSRWGFLPRIYETHTLLDSDQGDVAPISIDNLKGFSKSDIPAHARISEYRPSIEGRGDYNNMFPAGQSIFGGKFGMTPNFKARAVLKASRSGRVLFDVEYSSDKNARRTTTDQPKNPRYDVGLLGCSFVFGDGLSDSQTLASHLQGLLPGARVLNFGRSGGSPSNTLSRIVAMKNPQFSDISNNSHFIFFHLDDHVRRVVGTLSWLRDKSSMDMPAYVMDASGSVVSAGSFIDKYGLLAFPMFLLSKSKTLEYFKVELPQLGEEEVLLNTKIMLKIKDQVSARFPGSIFSVVIFPYQNRFGPRMSQLLKSEGVEVLDLTNLPIRDILNEHHENDDGHPSSLANKLVAALVYKRFFEGKKL